MKLEKVYDELYGMIEDLKKKIAALSGGSEVTITPTLESGEKVADYSIDGTEGAIYAPSVTAGDYKETETQIGNFTDDRPVYRKVLISDSFSCSTTEGTLINNAYDPSDDVLLEYTACGKVGNAVVVTGNYGSDYQGRFYLNNGRLDGFVKWGSEASAIAILVLVYYKISEAPTETNTKNRRKK